MNNQINDHQRTNQFINFSCWFVHYRDMISWLVSDGPWNLRVEPATVIWVEMPGLWLFLWDDDFIFFGGYNMLELTYTDT